MEIEVGNFITAIENEDYHKETITARASDVDSMGVADVMVPVIDKFENSIKDNKLTQIELVIDYADGPVFVRLESGIINLPYSNIDKVDNFFKPKGKSPSCQHRTDAVKSQELILEINDSFAKCAYHSIGKTPCVGHCLAKITQ